MDEIILQNKNGKILASSREVAKKSLENPTIMLSEILKILF